MKDEEEYFRNIIRQRAKTTTGSILDTYVKGRLGLVVDAAIEIKILYKDNTLCLQILDCKRLLYDICKHKFRCGIYKEIETDLDQYQNIL